MLIPSMDFDLIRKYDRPGPRYTSYPSALHFSAAHLPKLTAAIQANNQTPRELSLYVHLPFCRSLCWYCGCNTVITRRRDAASEYLDHLEGEIGLARKFLHPGRRVTQLHIGGGTPTFLSASELRRLGTLIRQGFELAPEIEASVEIDARSFDQDQVRVLREIGFNRASFGVQDVNAEVQAVINRRQPWQQTADAIAAVRQAGFESVGIDLIYGLPKQTEQSFSETLDCIVSVKPDRLAVYSYAHVPRLKPAQLRLEKAGLPQPSEKFALLRLTEHRLQTAGYVYIGMDHFAREGDELVTALRNGTLRRNFQGYSTHAPADVYAFGLSAISQIGNAYWQNHKSLPEYYAAVEQGRYPWQSGYVLDGDDRVRAAVIMSLMCQMRVNYAVFRQDWGVDFCDYFAPELESLRAFESDGLVQLTPVGIEVTWAGRYLIRNIAMQFDRYLGPQPQTAYSRTV